MARRRWQQGSISKQLHKGQQWWCGRYWGPEDANGRRPHPRVYLGTVASMTKRMALRALQPYIDKGNNVVGAPAKVVCGKGSITFADFADKWLTQVLRDKKVSTRDVWGGALRYRLLPRWGKYAIADIDPESVKVWFEPTEGWRYRTAHAHHSAERAGIHHVKSQLSGDTSSRVLALALNSVNRSQRLRRYPTLMTTRRLWRSAAMTLFFCARWRRRVSGQGN